MGMSVFCLWFCVVPYYEILHDMTGAPGNKVAMDISQWHYPCNARNDLVGQYVSWLVDIGARTLALFAERGRWQNGVLPDRLRAEEHRYRLGAGIWGYVACAARPGKWHRYLMAYARAGAAAPGFMPGWSGCRLRVYP
jgi:hypothetical protein